LFAVSTESSYGHALDFCCTAQSTASCPERYRVLQPKYVRCQVDCSPETPKLVANAFPVRIGQIKKIPPSPPSIIQSRL